MFRLFDDIIDKGATCYEVRMLWVHFLTNYYLWETN